MNVLRIDATYAAKVIPLMGFLLLCVSSLSAGSPASAGHATAGAVAKSADSGAASNPKLSYRGAPYRIQQGDVLELTFTRCPEFDQQVTVQPDGAISLKGIGELAVQDQTLPGLTSLVITAYSTIMRQPEPTVVLKDFERPYFIAAGEVVHPGKYDLRTSFTITEALAVAGGLNKDANQRQVLLYRRLGDEKFETRVIDEKKLMASRDLSDDIHLLPGDVIFISKSKMSHVKPYLPGSNIFLNPFSF